MFVGSVCEYAVSLLAPLLFVLALCRQAVATFTTGNNRARQLAPPEDPILLRSANCLARQIRSKKVRLRITCTCPTTSNVIRHVYSIHVHERISRVYRIVDTRPAAVSVSIIINRLPYVLFYNSNLRIELKLGRSTSKTSMIIRRFVL